MVIAVQHLFDGGAGTDERSSFAMNSTRRRRSPTYLPIWAGAFVVLICFAILALSGWREWSTREAELRNAEVDVANLAESLTQHADDTLAARNLSCCCRMPMLRDASKSANASGNLLLRSALFTT